ncbi:hypothetical protein BU25DRAFT_164969 [Macroventuria anomochaeta]|uniref:Uncharacterized protein n=1 Tax=Macroventuria anomochaeta TaxID=301207 RepID=A0ACB6RPZ8_9PLEO|nr:uncharacterized protein BU25DRAFT_164969 [Macroventuria anomochaeta]KAF2623956.1 hypothetical protein BU25DRAFT_164969 [Macroventuria anomochaeta]
MQLSKKPAAPSILLCHLIISNNTGRPGSLLPLLSLACPLPIETVTSPIRLSSTNSPKQNATQRAGDSLPPLGAYPRDLTCSHRWNDGDEGAYGSQPMTSQMAWHGIVTCATNSKQLVHKHVWRRSATQQDAGGRREIRGPGSSVVEPWPQISRSACRSPCQPRPSRSDAAGQHVRGYREPELVVSMGVRLHGVLKRVVEIPERRLGVRQRLYTRLWYLVQFSNLRSRWWRCVIIRRRFWDW